MTRARLAVALAFLVVAGCAGPKRRPPVETGPPSSAPIPAVLAIGLAENETAVVLRASGGARLIERDGGRILAHLTATGDSVVCTRVGDRVRWRVTGQAGEVAVMVLRPDDSQDRVQSGELVYRGELQVMPSTQGGGLTVINNVDLEAYLRGVVPWEIGRHPADKLAALQAQAVAARTYTISHLNARRSRGFDLFASVMDQVYKGAADEDAVCNRAIETTTGQVLRANGHEIEAYYSGCCGGVSSEIAEVWARGPRSYLKSTADGPAADGQTFCAPSKNYHWRTAWTVAELEKTLAETLPAYLQWAAASPARTQWTGATFVPRTAGSDGDSPGALQNLEIARRTTSGRVAELLVTTAAGVYHVRGDRTRWVLRPADGHPFILRSAKFALELERENTALRRVAARGQGYGHGIGLCQNGALARAAAGASYQEILAHYYPGAVLATLRRH